MELRSHVIPLFYKWNEHWMGDPKFKAVANYVCDLGRVIYFSRLHSPCCQMTRVVPVIQGCWKGGIRFFKCFEKHQVYTEHHVLIWILYAQIVVYDQTFYKSNHILTS